MLKYKIPAGLFALAATALVPLSDAQARTTCYWYNNNPGPIKSVVNVGSLYIARDAKVGDPIGPVERHFILGNGGKSVHCENDGTGQVINFDISPTTPRVPGVIPRVNGVPVNGSILQTNIPGVGLLFKLGQPYDGTLPDYWRLTSPDAVVPVAGYIDRLTPFPLTHNILQGYTTLIKTGPIAPGIHTLDSGKELASGSFTAVPNAFSVALTGSVTQAECTLSTNPVSADPVQLGEWSNTDFTHEGYTTTPVPFSITLNSCVSDPLPGGFVATAHIRLDPTAGSTTLNAGQGLFSLGSGSTAQGVGIQVLGQDAITPVALESDVLQGAIPHSGGMLLEFNARYYQTGPSTDVRSGSADASLAFTITYK